MSHKTVSPVLLATLKDSLHALVKWKRISQTQSARRQYLSWLKASAFFSLQKIVVYREPWGQCYNVVRDLRIFVLS